jgi:hypothetical protein
MILTALLLTRELRSAGRVGAAIVTIITRIVHIRTLAAWVSKVTCILLAVAELS